MLERLKKTLVSSFVGAIALGWLFAQGIFHFASVFSAPVAGWIVRREYRAVTDRAGLPTGFLFQDALAELVKSVALLVVGYFLLRWLYLKPLDQTTEQGSRQDR